MCVSGGGLGRLAWTGLPNGSVDGEEERLPTLLNNSGIWKTILALKGPLSGASPLSAMLGTTFSWKGLQDHPESHGRDCSFRSPLEKVIWQFGLTQQLVFISVMLTKKKIKPLKVDEKYKAWSRKADEFPFQKAEIASRKSCNFSIGLSVEVKAGPCECSRRLETLFHF